MRRDTTRPQRTQSTTHNYLFISDLHLSEGVDPETGKHSRNEDFFYDDALARFIVYHVNLTNDRAADPIYQKPWKLYINGDFLEFLQVTSLPAADDEILQHPDVKITDNVKKYGLGTSEPESVWKLQQIVDGHTLVFQALGWFLAQPDNELIILKGNHDIELFWPAVQKGILDHIANQYHMWYRRASRGFLPDSPLPLNRHPEKLTPEFRHRVSFPSHFAYEAPLFFVEHGNQYDPNNAFENFDNPILEDRPHLIELPSGSFFVRYFFNQVEQMHPFADNLRPLSRYINWVINQHLGEVVRMVLKQPRDIFRAIWQVIVKSGKISGQRAIKRGQKEKDSRSGPGLGRGRSGPKRDSNKPMPGLPQLLLFEELKSWAQEKAHRRNQRNIAGIAIQFILRVIATILVLWALRELFVGTLVEAAILFLTWAAVMVVRLLLANQAEEADHYVSLPGVARRIRHILNREYRGHYTGVQFHIFGHDHQAAIEELSGGVAEAQRLPFRQWYVNTGSWLPSFNELERLTRRDVQLAFLRIIPDRPDFAQAVPELMEWHPAENRPVPIRILDPQK